MVRFQRVVAATALVLAAAVPVGVPVQAAAQAADVPTVSDDPVAYARALKDPGWMATPGGLMRKECVQPMPAGARLNNGVVIHASGVRETVKPCTSPRLVRRLSAAAAETEWMQGTWWDSPTWLRRLHVNYAVPAAPSRTGAVIFVFSSFQNSSHDTILQPVLTYGTNGGIGGNYWYINSWYVWGNNARTGPTVRVNTGDTIFGAMEGNDCANTGTGCHWAVRTVNNTTGAESRIDITSGSSFRNAQGGVLEVYDEVGCAMLPANKHTAYRNIKIYGPTFNQLTPSFQGLTWNQQCGMYTSFTSTTTDIIWTVG